MPHVNIKYFGQEFTAEHKGRLAAAITEVVSDGFGVDRKAVSIALEPVAEPDWGEAVVDSEITGRAHLLIQEPGYLDDRQEHP
ncbi:MAG TPA: tautomerase family protein [Nocardiopsis listeri]|uniref:tautomerase family protein n=1 Tax=Nocardiopsis listeri TaxID=53440 RepID=UPI001E06CC74|nr:tautomerase family protein [Nocardiopsis listeri]HJE60550.1 tautomerase family protein [Nocardiopsis listeri]